MNYESLSFQSGWDFEKTEVVDGVVKNVLLCGWSSANGYDFKEGSWGDASLYKNKPVMRNHSPYDMRVEDYIGSVQNPRIVNGLPRGDIHVVTGKEAGDEFLRIAESKPTGIGMSHVAAYQFDSEHNVERVLDVLSVDCVVNPATTKTLSENKKELSTMDAEVKALYEKQIADLTEKLESANQKIADLTEAQESAQQEIADLSTERDTLKTANEAYELKERLVQRKESAVAAIKAAGLDPADAVVCSESFINQVASAADDAREQLINDRKALVESVGTKPQLGGRERASQESKAFDPSAKVAELWG